MSEVEPPSPTLLSSQHLGPNNHWVTGTTWAYCSSNPFPAHHQFSSPEFTSSVPQSKSKNGSLEQGKLPLDTNHSPPRRAPLSCPGRQETTTDEHHEYLAVLLAPFTDSNRKPRLPCKGPAPPPTLLFHGLPHLPSPVTVNRHPGIFVGPEQSQEGQVNFAAF